MKKMKKPIRIEGAHVALVKDGQALVRWNDGRANPWEVVTLWKVLL